MAGGPDESPQVGGFYLWVAKKGFFESRSSLDRKTARHFGAFRRSSGSGSTDAGDAQDGAALGGSYRESGSSPSGRPRTLQFPGALLSFRPVTHQTCSGVRTQPIVYCAPDGSATIVFRGCIRNVEELLSTSPFFRGENASIPNSPVARKNWLRADPASLAAEVVLHMYLCSRDSPIVFLNELEGSYSFAIYDDRQTAFAARDCSGREPLFYTLGSDGSVAVATEPLDVPAHDGWKELPAGMYLAGRNHQLAQHSLSLSELYSKEKRMNDEEGETLESALSHPASPSRRSQATSSPIQIPRFGGLPVA